MRFLVPEMISVPAGSIVLRDARTKTSRVAQLQSFTVAPVPVTWELYSSVLGVPVPNAEDANAPAHSVSWRESVIWCNALSRQSGLTPPHHLDGSGVVWDVSADGFRLPTEAEWEWACRAGSTGPQYGPLREISWMDDDAVSRAQKVGRTP